MKKIISFFILSVLLVGIFVSVYRPHIDYEYPLHYDEWLRLNEIQHLVWTGQNDVYYPNLIKQYPKPYYQFGFDVGMAYLAKSAHLDPLLFWQWGASVLSVIIALVIYFLALELGKNRYVAFLAVVLFGLLPTNIALLGTQYFLPSNVGYLLMLLMLYLMVLYFKTHWKQYLYLFYVLSAVGLTIYPLTMIFIAPWIVMIFFILEPFKKSLKFLFWYIMSFVPLLLLYYFYATGFGLTTTGTLLFHIKNVVIFKGESGYTIFGLFGIIGTILALFGIFSTRRDMVVFVVAMAVTANLLTLKLFNFSVLAFHSRLIYMSLIMFCMFAPLGLLAIWNDMKKYKVRYPIVLALAGLMMIVPVNNYLKAEPTPIVITENDIVAMEFIKDNYTKKVILAPAFTSVAIYSQTGNYVATMSLTVQDSMFGKYDPWVNFIKRDDKARQNLIWIYDVDIVYSPVQIKYDKLKEVYNKNNIYIYEVRKIQE